jgi:hypothetical protein
MCIIGLYHVKLQVKIGLFVTPYVKHVDWSIFGTHVFSEPYEITIHTSREQHKTTLFLLYTRLAVFFTRVLLCS